MRDTYAPMRLFPLSLSLITTFNLATKLGGAGNMSCKGTLQLYLTDARLSRFNLRNPGETLPLNIIRMERLIATEQCYTGVKISTQMIPIANLPRLQNLIQTRRHLVLLVLVLPLRYLHIWHIPILLLMLSGPTALQQQQQQQHQWEGNEL